LAESAQPFPVSSHHSIEREYTSRGVPSPPAASCIVAPLKIPISFFAGIPEPESALPTKESAPDSAQDSGEDSASGVQNRPENRLAARRWLSPESQSQYANY